VSVAAALRWLKLSSAWTWRALGWMVGGVALASAILVVALRYWFLPNVDLYRDEIAAAISSAVDLRVTIGRISADWDGMRPMLTLEQVTVFDKAGRRALELARVENTLAWRSLPSMRLHFYALDIYRPTLEIRRDANGVLSVAGIELRTDDREHAGFVDWLLAQRDIEVHNAEVSWTDELRHAPPLRLSDASLQILNRGNHHRFGLRATPPPQLAAPIDVRGDLRGHTLEVLSEWNGRLFLQLEHVDLAAWSPWVDVPVDVSRGSGSVRSWLTFSHNALAEVVADLRLSNVNTRLRNDLPRLELDEVAGRLTWKQLQGGFELSGSKLALSGAGARLEPADFRLKVASDAKGIRTGELDANALELGAVVMLADRLPLDRELRAELVGFSPRGKLHDVSAKWKGEWPRLSSYAVRGRFEALAVNRHDNFPGLSGLSGNIDATEKGGTLHVNGEHIGFELPRIFAAPLAFDTLTAQFAWTRAGRHLDLKFNNVAFANADAAGTLSGTYRTIPETPGEIDLTGALTRANARAVPRYIPITILKTSRPWFERALVAGQSSDVRFRVKGKVQDFPFVQEKTGIFSVVAKVTGGTLDYAEKWPRIENMEGDLQFRGARMDFVARQGTIDGVKLSKVQGEIPDLKARPEVLTVTGEADGRTSQFLAFVAKTPVSDMIDRFTEPVQAQGLGRLGLKLTLPLGRPETSQVAGTVQLIDNQIVFDRDLPPLDHANGRIEFTESSVRTSGANGVFLGGPVMISGSAQRDGVTRVALQGRVNVDNVRKAGGPAWMQQLRGSTEWRGALTLRKKVPELVIESNLQGIASSLPAPFGKVATENVPLRLERRVTGPQQDRISVVYGDIVRAELARRNDGKQFLVDRGVIRFGAGDAGEIDRPGIWIRGTIGKADFDDWLAFSRSGDGESGGYSIAGADVKFQDIDFFGRRFTDLALTMSQQGAATQLTLAGRDIEGSATWRGEGKGRLTARLKRLVLPSSEPSAPALVAKAASGKPPELPALDIIVDQFQHGHKQLGRLELNAVYHERDWRIEKLRLANADSTLTADGAWRGWLTQPRTQLNVRMDISDIGRTLARWGFPPGIRRGTAKIEGQLDWSGSPHDFDYPSLGGQLTVAATNGQFVKLDPGIAKLLGIVSLQALPRRITLDFRDVFSEGLAFDTIVGALKIDRGIVRTENFRIQAPSTRVLMSGEVDLARETQKLRVRVTPHISESVSIAGALIGGPVAGVAAFLAQKMLKDPLEQLASFDYNVTGSWSEPQVSKVERQPLAAAPESVP
jgi:uncharacterized protein (TIGR02099 family)